MLTLKGYKIMFFAVFLVGTLLFATPTLALIVHLPGTEKFSELWVLGSSHTTSDYPFNIAAGENYTVFVGVANHMGSVSYYVVEVKFRNETDPLPDTTLGTPCPLELLYEQRVILQDGGVWEKQLSLSFSNISSSANQCVVGTLKIDDVTCIVNKPAVWDSSHKGYYYQLLFELWIYNAETEAVQFHDRYCTIWLNMTLSSIS